MALLHRFYCTTKIWPLHKKDFMVSWFVGHQMCMCSPLVGLQGPVVQSVVSLMSLLRVISINCFSGFNIQYSDIFCWKNVRSFCKSYSHFFSKKFQHICVSLDVDFNESLTNDVVSFEQLGPGMHFLPEASSRSLLYICKGSTRLHFLQVARAIAGCLQDKYPLFMCIKVKHVKSTLQKGAQWSWLLSISLLYLKRNASELFPKLSEVTEVFIQFFFFITKKKTSKFHREFMSPALFLFELLKMSKLTREPLVLYHLPKYWSRKKIEAKNVEKNQKT